MNKDVIYIEPEDDITDIITKVENSKQKIVALVPPKKAGVLRSVVNIKLITKAAAGAKKTVVLVTTDPSITKLAAAVKLPITKDLQTAPAIPDAETEDETVSDEEVAEAEMKNENEADEEESGDEGNEKELDEKEEEAEKEENKNDKKKTKEKKPKGKKSDNKIVQWFVEHKKLAILSGIGGVALILLLVWMFVIAPKATVTVGIKTTTNNFSENVTFTEKLEDENAEEGKFYLEEKKIESVAEVKFDATGTKNVGEKAHGNVIVFLYFSAAGKVPVNSGTSFTISGLTYLANKSVELVWDGEPENCENEKTISGGKIQCLISARVEVTASEPGTKYNIEASSGGWNTVANVSAYSDAPMTGGTDKSIVVVQQSDIDKAKEELEISNESEDKERLYDEIDETMMVIESSFTRKTADAVSTPAVGEEVKEGERPTLKATTTTSVMVVDKTKIEEFIAEKAKLDENYKIYEMKSPFFENFIKTDSGYTAKLKTSYVAGPKVTENNIIEIIKGKGFGVAQHDLKDIDGVSSVRIDPSFPWVTSIPGNPNKITVILEVKE